MAVQGLLEPTVLQEVRLRLVLAVLGLAILLQLLLFIMLVAVAGVVLVREHLYPTPVLVEQAAVVLAGLVRLEQEPTEL